MKSGKARLLGMWIFALLSRFSSPSPIAALKESLAPVYSSFEVMLLSLCC